LDKVLPPVLIVGFRRHENLARILDICTKAGATKIYVTLDGPRFESDQRDISACELVLLEFEKNFEGVLKKRVSPRNQGAAYSVLSGCDWVLSSEEFLIVIEDDCLPSLDFFNFILDSRPYLASTDDAFLIGGTQFTPKEITQEKWYLSEYPLIWGWATSRQRWLQLRNELQNLEYRKLKLVKSAEYAYWEAGARRAFSGFVDAWDIPLVHVMRKNNWKCILPGINLVTNIGNDLAATHTFYDSRWLGQATENYASSNEAPKVNPVADRWLRVNLYQINSRHLLSTVYTRLLDFMRVNRLTRKPLLERWN
jgi:hypothetical protein